MTKVAIVYHSGYGHTKRVAEFVAKGAEGVEGTTVSLITAPDAAENIDILNDADAIIFGSPTYMGGMSGPMATFKDATSKAWMSRVWENKIAAGFTNSGSYSGDKSQTLTQFVTLAMQLGMIWVGLELMPGNNSSKGSENDLNRIGSSTGLMTQANTDESAETAPPEADLKTAEHFGARVATVTAQWVRGKSN